VGQEILGHLKADPRQRKLLPPRDAQVLLDQHYIMAAAGVLSQHYPEAARALLCASLGCRSQDAHHGRTVTIHVGDDLVFALNYSALLAAMTSPYVQKRPLTGGG